MPIYETVIMARQELSTPQVTELTEQLSGILTENGGKILKTEQWGLKSLAYKINKAGKANFFLIESDSPSSALHEMERQMRIHEDVVRFMSVRLEEPTKEPSPMMRKSSDERTDEKEAA